MMGRGVRAEVVSQRQVAVRPRLCSRPQERPDLSCFKAEKQVRNATFSGRCHTPLPQSVAMDLPIVIGVFVVGIAAGALGLRLWARPRRTDREPPDGGLSGLAEATAALDGRVSGVHEMVVDLLREQSTAGERLAAVGEQSAELHMTLASHRARGHWGELLAERVIDSAGMQEGVHFVRQRTLPTGSRPDFTFFLADGMLLHVDAKFPLENYRRLERADTDEERETARKAFIGDIKRHVAAVAGRGYSDPATTVGISVIFISNPAIFHAAVEADLDLIPHALSHHIMLADAQTLMAVLMMVRSASNAFRVQHRTRDILRIITDFRGEWAKFSAHLDKTDKQLTTVLRSWEALTGTRRRQLQRRMDRIDGLEVGDEAAPIAPDTPAAALPDSGPSDRAEIVQSCANGSASSQRPHRAPAAAT